MNATRRKTGLAAQGRRSAVGPRHSKDNSNGRSKPGRIVITARGSGRGPEHPQTRMWRRMHRLRVITGRKSVRMCGCAIGGSVRIQREGGTRASIIGTMRCGSPAVCPRCNGAISRKRVDVLALAIEELQAKGYLVAMVALTMRHTSRTSLLWGIDTILKSWSDMFAGRRLEAWSQLGMVGAVRTLEATHGRRHGWHPHLHALVVLEPGSDLVAFREHLVSEWQRRVSCDSERGVYCKPAESARKAAGYIAKGAANEVLLGTDKATSPGRVHPFELLDVRSERSAMLWREWETAVRSRRFLGWTGKKAIEAVLERPLEVPDAVPDEPVDTSRHALELNRCTWLDCLRWGMVADVLQLVRRGLDTKHLVTYDHIRATQDNGCAETLRLCLRC